MNVFLFSIFDYFKHEKSRTIVEKMEVFYYFFPDLLLPYLLFVQNWYCQGFSNSEIVHRCKFCTILLCMGIHIGSAYKKVTCLCYQFLPHRKFKGHTNSNILYYYKRYRRSRLKETHCSHNYFNDPTYF